MRVLDLEEARPAIARAKREIEPRAGVEPGLAGGRLPVFEAGQPAAGQRLGDEPVGIARVEPDEALRRLHQLDAVGELALRRVAPRQPEIGARHGEAGQAAGVGDVGGELAPVGHGHIGEKALVAVPQRGAMQGDGQVQGRYIRVRQQGRREEWQRTASKKKAR
ncbi:MAG: hypothetical protein R3C69_07925 [Geminicoccaceae bacterium]